MWAFLNEEFLPEEQLVLHASDLSIQRGYALFDFFKVVNGIPVFLSEHLDRFFFSAEQMRLEIRFSKHELKKILFELLEKNSVTNTGVRITLTGGYSQDGFQLSRPNLIILLRSYSSPLQDQLAKGIKLMSYEYQRQLPQIKTIDYLMAIWLQPLIRQHGADDVLYHQNGMVSECPRSNFFIVSHDNKLVTPSKNILKGVIRSKLIQIAKPNLEVEERELSIEEIKTAREAFITSTTKTILPVRQIDEHIFDEKGSIATQLYDSLHYLQFKVLLD
jgi:D-alanine transaminase/branched-chain amino acid aminotransferase